jgi:hypothetical protein
MYLNIQPSFLFSVFVEPFAVLNDGPVKVGVGEQ